MGDALQLPTEDIAGAMRVLRAPEASAVRRMCGGAATDHHGLLARVKVELLALSYCAASCVITKFYPPLKLRVFVDDITALLLGSNKKVAEMAKKVMKRQREEVGKLGLTLSVNEKWKGRKEQDDCVKKE